MNLLKTSLIFSILFATQVSSAQICVNTSSNYKMFGSVLRSGALARGHELAFQDAHFTDYQQFAAETDADLAVQIEKMSSGSCSVILGLFTSRECLIAGPILKRKKLIGVSSSCGHDNIKNFSPYIYTIIPPMSAFSDKILEYFNQKNDLGKVYAVYQPTDVYSEISFSQFKMKNHKPIIEIPVASDGQFDMTKFAGSPDQIRTILFFTYPLPSAKILMDLSDHGFINKRTTILGASSWPFDVSVFRSIQPILEKAHDVVAADVVDWQSAKNTTFVKRFKKKFGREPLNIEILAYDVTRLSIDCYKKSLQQNKYDENHFQNCMTKSQHQSVAGVFSFKEGSPFADRPLYLTHLLNRI